MCVKSFLRALILSLLLDWTCCVPFNQPQASSYTDTHGDNSRLVRVPLLRTPYEPNGNIYSRLNDTLVTGGGDTATTISALKRKRREASSLAGRHIDGNEKDSNDISESSFQKDEVGWSIINAEVDIIVPMIVRHLQQLNIEHLRLPNMRETISVTPLFVSYEAGLYLSNGIIYNIEGIKRFGDAFMTYKTDKSFLCRFNLTIKHLQFEYDFLIKLMALEGYGRVIGSLDDTNIFGELAIGVVDTRLKLNDFRITSFENIEVQLDHRRIIRQLTGVILSPITNLFRDHITTSISDGLKEQMQLLVDDFSDKDPLHLKTFAKQMLAGLTGEEKTPSNDNLTSISVNSR